MASDAVADRVFYSEEYEFSARIPESHPFCVAESGSHVHGIGTVLSGADCDEGTVQAWFNIWGDYNVLFLPTAIQVLHGHPACGQHDPTWATGEMAWAIGGLRTAVCRSHREDGTIQMALAAQTGSWSEPSSDEERESPRINLTVNLLTNDARFDGDYKWFLMFLQSIQVGTASRR